MKRTLQIFLMLTTLTLTACTGTTPSPQSASESDATAKPVSSVVSVPAKAAPVVTLPSTAEAPVMLFESWPLETTLDNANIVDVEYAWLDAISHAQSTIDFSEFYTNEREGTALARVVSAIQEATQRGVKIRFIVDKKMYKDDNIPLADQHDTITGIELRKNDNNATKGGVQHTK